MKMPSSRVIIGVLITVGSFAGATVTILNAERRGEPMEWTNRTAKEVRMVNEISDTRSVEYRVAESEEVERLVLAPLRTAAVDDSPKAYEVFGHLTVRFDSDAEETVTLFFPFGHFKKGGEYYVADLGELASRLADVFAYKASQFKAFRKE